MSERVCGVCGRVLPRWTCDAYVLRVARQETVYDMVQREAHAKVEAAHDWKGKLGWRFGFGYDFGYDEIKVCRRCGHSDVFAHAHGLTECEAWQEKRNHERTN